MDKELIAHLSRLSSLEMDTMAEVKPPQQDLLSDLEASYAAVSRMGLPHIADTISAAIGEIQRLRNRVDDLSAAAYISRSSP